MPIDLMRKIFILFVLMINVDSLKADDIFINEFESLLTTRINSMALRDPHVYVDMPVVGCGDVTDSSPFGFSVNGSVNNSINNDSNNDGLLDLSLITWHNTDQPKYLVARPTVASFSEGDCQLDLTCSKSVGAPVVDFSTQTQYSGTCLSAEPGTTRPYTPAIIETSGACYVTDPESVTLNLNGILITLEEYQQALRYNMGDITTDQGFHKGFLTETMAESIILPASLPLVGGQTLASVLRGHSTNCSTSSDMDVHPVFGDGWWMYFNSTSDLIELN